MEPIRAILFDYGHTLVDFQRTQEALQEAYEQIRDRIEAVAYMEVPELLDLIERVAGGIDQIVGQSYLDGRMEEVDLVATFGETLSGVGFDLPEDVLQHIVTLDHSAYSNSITVDPSVLDALEGLTDNGFVMGLVSNVTLLPHLMRADLERLGIGPLLKASVFSSETGVRKPDPRIFEEALHRIGVRPPETVFVGDRLYDDIGGAQAVGMRAVLSHQFRDEDDPAYAPDAVINHVRQLRGLLQEWNAGA